MPTSTPFPFAVRALLLAFVGLLCNGQLLSEEPTAEQVEFFEKKIRPVLVQHCYECHSADSKKLGGELLLDSRTGTRRGGESGPAVVPGNLNESLLLEAVRYEGLEMPPKGKLPANVIDDFQKWVELGAPDPRKESVAKRAKKPLDVESGRKFWAFQPPTRHDVPDVANRSWPRQPVDWFILAGQEQEKLSPAAVADRHTLIRRLSFDLTGLPPTPDDVERFANDSSPFAFERLVDRLLGSPHFGERWARHWLDIARYAEDQAHIVGNNKSLFYPNAYLYRDWVIRALNRDVGYDEFIRLQLAADLMDPEDSSQYAALGFIGLGPKYYRRNDLSVMADEWEDRVDVVSRGLLGLTVACARCHDHKYDPISTEDYYALAGVFASTTMFNRPLGDKNAKGKSKSPGGSLHIVREKTPVDLHVFVRGDVNNKGPQVKRRFLRVLCSDEPKPFAGGSGRLELATAIASPENPLTARVMVNRTWLRLFGQPLVGTPSNFGAIGERPTHPNLLDDLSARFMDANWSLKWLVREIVLSATYRQSSNVSPLALEVDPSNRLLSRFNRRRLDVEAWRDNILAATNELSTAIGGTSIDVEDPLVRRRTMYSRVSRFSLAPMLAMFDFPDPNVHAAIRAKTTTPLQKLFAMNSPFMVRQADRLAARLQAYNNEAGETTAAQRVEMAYRWLLARRPTRQELDLALDFLAPAEDDVEVRWKRYAQVLLVSNEMQFLD